MKKKVKKSFFRPTWTKVIIFFIIAIIFSGGLRLLPGSPFWYVVDSNAMTPSYAKGDIVFLKKN